jgi:hypothetical protein
MSHRGGDGAKWLFVPDVEVNHEIPVERERFAYFVRRCWLEGLGKAALLRTDQSPYTALSEEARYVRITLVKAVLRYGLLALVGQRDAAGKALAVAAGLLTTVAGFAHGALRCRVSHAACTRSRR